MSFDLTGFLPHGVCFAGRPDLILLHVVSDAIIAIAYFMIPVTLVYFLRRKGLSALSFNWALALFAAFILLCGSGHLLDILGIWRPYYYLEGLWTAATALVSIVTALAILPLVPRLLSMRTPEELEAVNRDLAQANARLAETNARLEDAMVARENAEAEMRRSLAEAKRNASELEQFAYIASHDLQAPLRNIAGFAQLLERRYRPQLNGDGLEFLGFIGQGVSSMQALIQDLLALSRVGRSESSGFEIRPLRATVEQALRAVAPQIESSGATVELGELPEVIADHGLLAQLFQNLFANALKFQKPGAKPVLGVEAEADGVQWHIRVRDNGIGIPPAQLEAIFAIFRRLHPQDEYDGTGIGLAIVRKIAAHHGGSVSAESAGEGFGAVFHLWLPQQSVPREASASLPAVGTA